MVMLAFCYAAIGQTTNIEYGCFKDKNNKSICIEFDEMSKAKQIKYKSANKWIKLTVKVAEHDVPSGSCQGTETIYNEVINNKINGKYVWCKYECHILSFKI